MVICWTVHIHVNVNNLFLGKEQFPAVWPEELLHTFQTLLSKGVRATVESFDGSANVLSLCLVTESGRSQLTAIILDALQELAKTIQEQAKSIQEQAKTPCIQSMSVPMNAPEEAPTSTCQSISTEPEARTLKLEDSPAPTVPGW